MDVIQSKLLNFIQYADLFLVEEQICMLQDSTSVSSELSDLTLPEEPRLDGLVIGIPREYHCPGVSSEVVDAWTKVADIMEDSGAEVRLPHLEIIGIVWFLFLQRILFQGERRNSSLLYLINEVSECIYEKITKYYSDCVYCVVSFNEDYFLLTWHNFEIFDSRLINDLEYNRHSWISVL